MARLKRIIQKEIRHTVNRGLASGDGRFAKKIGKLTKERLTPRKAGRPKKKTENMTLNILSGVGMYVDLGYGAEGDGIFAGILSVREG